MNYFLKLYFTHLKCWRLYFVFLIVYLFAFDLHGLPKEISREGRVKTHACLMFSLKYPLAFFWCSFRWDFQSYGVSGARLVLQSQVWSIASDVPGIVSHWYTVIQAVGVEVHRAVQCLIRTRPPPPKHMYPKMS